MDDPTKYRSAIVSVITSPLGFFALSLLIVEGFLTIALVFSGLDPAAKLIGMWIGAILFFLVVLGVWILVLFKPTNLTFGEQSHLEHEKMSANFGTEQTSQTKYEISKGESASSA